MGRLSLSTVPGILVGLVLTAVLGWPAVAIVVVACQRPAADKPSGPGEIVPVPEDDAGPAVQRPLRLAFESVRLVVATEAIALAFGLALALVLFRTDVPGRRFMLGLLVIAAFVPMPLHAAAWLGGFGNAGRAQVFGLLPILRGWSGAAFVYAMSALPWVVLLSGVGLRTVEPELEEAALLDRPAWWVALFVTVRRALGAIAGAALAVAVLTAGDMTVTDLLLVRTYAEEAYTQLQLPMRGPAAVATVALPPLIVLGGLVLLGVRALLRLDPARLASAASGARLWGLGKGRVAVGLATQGAVGLFIGLPLYSLVWRAGRVGGAATRGLPPHWSFDGLIGTLRFAWDDSSEALFASSRLGAITATVGVTLAWSLAWLSRNGGFWRVVAAVSVAVALAAPGPVAGMALVFAYRDLPDLYDSEVMVVLAGVLRTFPFALLVLWPAIRTIAPELLDAAAIDGLGPVGIVFRVALPLTFGPIVAAWGVGFVLALGELPATNLVTPPGLPPLSVQIWGLIHTGVESHLAGVVLVMLGAIGVAATPIALFLARFGRGRDQIG